jgi:hypothetical protein
VKCKARQCTKGDQQVNYKETDLYAPTLKVTVGLERLLMAMIAAANGHEIYKIDTK